MINSSVNQQDLMKAVFFNYNWNNIWYFFDVRTQNLYWSYYTNIQKYVKGLFRVNINNWWSSRRKNRRFDYQTFTPLNIFSALTFLSIFWKKKKLCGWVWFFQVIWLPLYKRVKYIWQILQIQQKRGFNRFEIRTEGFKK